MPRNALGPVVAEASRHGRLDARDLLRESLRSLREKPGRTALTSLGTVVAVAAFVATLGVAATLAEQVSSRFAAYEATEIVIVDTDPAQGNPFSENADQLLKSLRGVEHAGVLWSVATNTVEVSRIPGSAGASKAVTSSVIAASPGSILAAQAILQWGRPFDTGHDSRTDRVALVGRALASQLDLNDANHRAAVLLNGLPYTVLGVVESVDRRPELLGAVIVPTNTAVAYFGPPSGAVDAFATVDALHIDAVIEQAPFALLPEDPERLVASAPPELTKIRNDIESDIGQLFLVLAGVALVVGTLVIANATTVSVLERTVEIGVRRALGATRRSITALFIWESALLGTAAGAVGAGIGVLAVAGISAGRGWTPVTDPMTVVQAPLVGTAIGLLASWAPARRASRIEPVEALRS